MLPLDLHVLGLPLAFILSQDQTLHRCALYNFRANADKAVPAPSLSVLLFQAPLHLIKGRPIYGRAPGKNPGAVFVSTVCQ